MNQVYGIVTERILEQLRRGVVPWRRPWASDAPKNLVSGKEYRGVNVFLLSAMPFNSPWWLTFRQAKERGGSVRRGERGTPVIFWTEAVRETSDGERESFHVLRYYTVFNLRQCDGIAAPDSPARAAAPIAECERVVAAMPQRPAFASDLSQAFYRPATDTVHMPALASFDSPAFYYSTLFHELAHATGHVSRLNRPTLADAQPFGSESYSKEELVAEMSAAMLCGATGIENAALTLNSASYLRHWIDVLRGDARLVVSAASQAQRAADFILGKTNPKEST